MRTIHLQGKQKMIEYPALFRCCECTVEEPNLEHLESHLWTRHMQKFPFNCALCSYPAMNPDSLAHHFRTQHGDHQTVEFVRKLEDEMQIRKLLANSITLPMFEHHHDEQFQQGDLKAQERLPRQNRLPIVLMPSTSNVYEGDEEYDVLEEEQALLEEVQEDEEEEVQFIDEHGNIVFVQRGMMHEELLEEEDAPYTSAEARELKKERIEKTVESVAVGVLGDEEEVMAETSQEPGFSLAEPVKKKRRIRGKHEEYYCRYCGKEFEFQSKMKQHERIHEGVKPFPCRYCSRRFTQAGALNTHERLHTGERPYHCTWECGKTFVSASARKTHELKHSGSKEFTCDVCGSGFSRPYHLKRHIKNIHGKGVAMNRIMASGYNDVVLSNLVHGVIENVREKKDKDGMEESTKKPRFQVKKEYEL